MMAAQDSTVVAPSSPQATAVAPTGGGYLRSDVSSSILNNLCSVIDKSSGPAVAAAMIDRATNEPQLFAYAELLNHQSVQAVSYVIQCLCY